MTEHAVLRLQGVTKTFGRAESAAHILRGIDLELAMGEVTGVMGPSGSGKTTLLTIAGALQPADSGRVEVAGEQLTGRSQKELSKIRRTRIGFIFQSFNLLSALTALENVEYVAALSIGRGSQSREAAAQLLGMVGLGHRADRLPKQLSGGEQQRVCIARALANGATLLLADEPTANLDSRRAREMMGLLRAVARDMGCGVLLVTHDLRASEFADRTLWLEDGHLQPMADGTAGR